MILVFSFSVYAEPANLYWKTQEMLHYYNSGQYARELAVTAGRAKTQLAFVLRHRKEHGKPAIVFDVDETALSNFQAIRLLLNALPRVGDKFSPKMLKPLTDPYHASAILPVLKLYKFAIKHHVTVFFITGRLESQRAGTIANLKKVGYTKWQHLYMSQPKYAYHNEGGFKVGIRKKLEHEGYDIIINISDQHGDLEGGYADYNFKLPNPFYYIQ